MKIFTTFTEHWLIDQSVRLNVLFFSMCRIICLLNVHSHHGDHHCEANITVKAAFLHTLGDLFHSFAVLVGAILIKINVSTPEAGYP